DLEAAMRGGHVGAPPVPGTALGAAAAAAGAAGVAGAAAAEGGYPTAATQVVPPAGEGGTQVLPPAAAAAGTAAGSAAAAPGSWSPLGTDTASFGTADEPEPRRRKALLWTLIAVAVAAVAGIIAIIALSQGDD